MSRAIFDFSAFQNSDQVWEVVKLVIYLLSTTMSNSWAPQDVPPPQKKPKLCFIKNQKYGIFSSKEAFFNDLNWKLSLFYVRAV